MPHTVLFLGAGASAAVGLPTTERLLPEMLRAADDGVPEEERLFRADSDARKKFVDLIGTLFPGFSAVHSRAMADKAEGHKLLPPVTDILSLVDYMLLTGNAARPNLSVSDLRELRTLIERGIFELLGRSENWDNFSRMDVPEGIEKEWEATYRHKILPRRSQEDEAVLERVFQWIDRERENGSRRVSIVSTNYDTEVEQRLYRSLHYNDVFATIDFGVPMREPKKGAPLPRPTAPHFGVYKLHGSLNWLRCDLCDNLYLNPVGAIAYLAFLLDSQVRSRLRDQRLDQLYNEGATHCHCGHKPLRHVIVAPSFVRSVSDPNVLAIWRAALEALRSADRWVIVGYSLPPEDVAIRSMLLRAACARDNEGHRPEIVVVQLEEKEPEKSRYELMFERAEYRDGGFARFVTSLQGPEIPERRMSPDSQR